MNFLSVSGYIFDIEYFGIFSNLAINCIRTLNGNLERSPLREIVIGIMYDNLELMLYLINLDFNRFLTFVS